MPASAELVERSGDLKHALVEFAQRRRFTRYFNQAVDRQLVSGPIDTYADAANVIDHFLFQHRLPDGRTIVELFVTEHPGLPEEEREMLLRWRDVVEGVFHVERRDGEALVTTNLVDELTYRVRSNMGSAGIDKIQRGSFLVARLVPLEDEWLLSGMSAAYPASHRDEVYRAVAELAFKNPTLVFRNPEKLAKAWQIQREEHGHFVDFFGADLVVLPGHELAERMRAYMRYRMHEVRGPAGKTAAQESRERHGSEPAEIDFGLTAEMTDAETVAVVYDEVEGLILWRDFGLLEEAFATPELGVRGRHRRIVLGYLKEASISPSLFRRLAERSPERASRVFAQLLKRPHFSWERDGEALMRRYKASYFEQTPLPRVVPLSPPLAAARVARSRPDKGASGGRDSRPTRLSNWWSSLRRG